MSITKDNPHPIPPFELWVCLESRSAVGAPLWPSLEFQGCASEKSLRRKATKKRRSVRMKRNFDGSWRKETIAGQL